MSNRVYLFSINFIPGTNPEERRVVGMSEWGNGLPIGFKILVSGAPKKCKSLVFDEAEAIIADYDQGVKRFLEFVERIPYPTAPALADEARTFLSKSDNKNPFLVLEPQEYFWLGDDEPAVQMERLLAELSDLSAEMENAIAEVKTRMHEETHPPGFFARLFGARAPVRRDRVSDLVFALALGGWSNSLFYDPT